MINVGHSSARSLWRLIYRFIEVIQAYESGMSNVFEPFFGELDLQFADLNAESGLEFPVDTLITRKPSTSHLTRSPNMLSL